MRLEPVVLLLALGLTAPAWTDEAVPAARARLQAARALEDQGEFPKALCAYHAILRPADGTLTTEEILDAHEGMARVLVRQGVFDKAAGVYRAALVRIDEAMAKGPTPDLCRRGHAIAFRLGDYARAARYCNPLLADTCQPADRDWALERTCLCYERQGNWGELAAFGESRLPMLPKGDRRSWLQMVTARAYSHDEDDDRAEELYKEVIADCPGTPAAELARSRLSALEALNEVGMDTPDVPPGETPVDLRRLAEVLSQMVSAPHPQALSGFRVSTDDKGALHLTLIKPGQQSQDLVLSKLSDLKESAPVIMAAYNRLGDGESGKEAEHPGYLGLSGHAISPDVLEVLHLPPGTAGLLVDKVLSRSPAEAAGLMPGDVILSLNDLPVDNFNIRALVRAIPAGETARLAVLRIGGERKTLTVKTGETPR